MKRLTAAVLTLFASISFAGPDCTKEPKEKWQNQAEFEKKLAETYEIKKFKVTKGNCYEIYGKNKQGQKIEIYFNPVTGEKVKEEID